MKKNNPYSLLVVILIFLSSSLFSQDIKVLFTKSVDNSVSSITNATTAVNIEDTICAYINMSTTTLDIAVWDNGSTAIVNAINSAYNRGVVVRYISSTNSLNSALSGLNAGVPILKRQSTLTSNVMHNKFVIIDNAIVLSGSMNYGNGSMFDDYNNFIIVHNTSLAQNYLIEFNEMWGGNGAQPNLSNSKFGPDKSDNTVHSFTIGGSTVESYFSPTDGTTAQIVNAINNANYTLDFATFTFTNNDLGDAVIAAKDRGVIVRGIIENENYFGSEFSGLIIAGVNVLSHSNVPYDFHHKYCIIDANYPSSDPTVVAGSHNWSNSAEDEYDENTLIIHDLIIANQYWEEFSQRFSELSPTSIINVLDTSDYIVYPNPVNNILTFDSRSGFKNANYKLLNYCGELIAQENNVTGKSCIVDIAEQPPGIYFFIVDNNECVKRIKFIKQ
ncbi:MAG: phospholipase D-like domain-containing protein [Bacteroidia bacterium]